MWEQSMVDWTASSYQWPWDNVLPCLFYPPTVMVRIFTWTLLLVLLLYHNIVFSEAIKMSTAPFLSLQITVDNKIISGVVLAFDRSHNFWVKPWARSCPKMSVHYFEAWGWAEKVKEESGKRHALRWLLPTGSYTPEQYIDNTVNSATTHRSRPFYRGDLGLPDNPSASYSFQIHVSTRFSMCNTS